MGVTLLLPAPLRGLAGGRSAVELAGSPGTVGEALEALRAAHPAVHDRIVTETGEVRRHVNLFVGEEDVRHTGGLATPLSAEARVFILPAVSGGRAGPSPRGFHPASRLSRSAGARPVTPPRVTGRD